MSSKHDTGGQIECLACEFEPFVRNNYFTGKMMGASDFIAETRYHQEKMRLHQARLHGWGVVCGLDVLQHPNADCRRRYVRIAAGSAVDCCGHDILVPEEEVLDLLAYGKVADLAKEQPARLHALQICVRFVECATETVPVLYDDCGCDDDGCAPNRILESYAFDVMVDPPLAALPRVTPAELGGAVFVRAPDAGLGTKTPRFGIAPLVGPALFALDAGQPTKLTVFDLATRHAQVVDLGAETMGLTGRGGFVFVSTGPIGGTTGVVQVFAPGGTSPLAVLDVPATTVASTLSLAASSDATRAAIVYVRETGDLAAFPEDATTGLLAASPLGTVASGLTGFVATPDGTAAYALDEAAGRLKAITLAATSSAVDATALPATAKPSAVVYLETGGKSLLVVASRTDKALYVLDVGNLGAATGLVATIPLDQPPEFVATGADGLVYSIEESGGAAFLRSIDLAPLLAGQPALVSAARAIPGSRLRIAGLLASGGSGIVVTDEQIEIACDELIWNQDCHACDMPNCLTLAGIERFQAGALVLDGPATTLAEDLAQRQARIDNRAGRRILASTQTLQAWLECLNTRGLKGDKGDPGDKGKQGEPGVGTPGPPGLGLYPDLPKILDIGWRFEETIGITAFARDYAPTPEMAASGISIGERVRREIIAGRAPPLTIFFNKPMKGITNRTLEVAIDAPWSIVEGSAATPVPSGLYLPIDLRLYGDIIEIPGPVPTPHTGETAAFAIAFVPHRQFFWTLNANDQAQAGIGYVLTLFMAILNKRAQIDPPRLKVALKGDFVFAPDVNGDYTEFGVLDGENIGGKLGEPAPAARQPPILGGKNPSGNLTQGGLFESWFFFGSDDRNGVAEDGFDVKRMAPVVNSFAAGRGAMDALPATANFSAPDAIVGATGVSAAVARRIVAARAQTPFTDAADFRTRAGISDREWKQLRGSLLIL